MSPLEREVVDSIVRLLRALSPAARAELRADLAEPPLLIDPDAGPVYGNEFKVDPT